jgi:hypothetical protein
MIPGTSAAADRINGVTRLAGLSFIENDGKGCPDDRDRVIF